MKKNNNAKKLVAILVSLVLLIIVGIFVVFHLSLKPISKAEDIVPFKVKENVSAKTVLKDLKDANIIRNDTVAYYNCRIKRNADFKAGNFEVDRSMNLDEIVAYLSNNDNIIKNTITITFKEGEWLKEYAYKLAENTNLQAEEIIAYWNDPEVVKGYMEEYPFLTDEILNSESRYYLEGYLFPNTYEFYRETNLDAVTRTFLNETKRIYEKYFDDFKANAMSIHEIFTLASIVQYEAADIEDMKNIASVFLNRLDINMPLQSSVTVCYSMDIDRQNDDWRDCEYNPDYESPYNTYKYYGLTPGPILNPGEDAILAVLEPASTDYLYFMADVCHDGKVYYSKDYATHQSYINKYINCY